MAAAVPFALQGGSALASYFMGKKNKTAMQTAQQQTGQNAAQVGAMAPGLMQQGQQLTGQGAGYLQQGAGQLAQAGNYYGNILSNRRSARESLAPEMTTALDFYRGGEQRNNRTLRGGQRDYANAELSRQKVGQLASYLPAARANAAQGMERVGSATGNLGGTAIGGGAQAAGQGVNAASNAGYLNNMAFGQAQQQRQNQGETGSAWGKLFSGALSAYLGSKGGGGGGGLPGTGVSMDWMNNSNNFGGG